ASILEVAYELLLLRVDAQDRQAGRGEDGPLYRDVVELLLTVSMLRRGLDLLGVDMQRVVEFAQQAREGGQADAVASRFQLGAQRAQAAADPFLRGHRIAGRFGGDQCLEYRQDQRRFFSTVGRPAPGWRI